MNTLTKRKRARLALQMLGKQPEPRAGDHVLIWARVDETYSRKIMATVSTRVGERAYSDQRFLVGCEDIALVTPERPI